MNVYSKAIKSLDYFFQGDYILLFSTCSLKLLWVNFCELCKVFVYWVALLSFLNLLTIWAHFWTLCFLLQTWISIVIIIPEDNACFNFELRLKMNFMSLFFLLTFSLSIWYTSYTYLFCVISYTLIFPIDLVEHYTEAIDLLRRNNSLEILFYSMKNVCLFIHSENLSSTWW